MIVVDSSAIMAVLLTEPDWADFMDIIADSRKRLMSASTYLELSIVTQNAGGRSLYDELVAIMTRMEIEIVPFDLAQAQLAAEAFYNFGRGRHPASLNFGDCFSYALAKSRGLPLLCKGNDFRRTDIEVRPTI